MVVYLLHLFNFIQSNKQKLEQRLDRNKQLASPLLSAITNKMMIEIRGVDAKEKGWLIRFLGVTVVT